MKNQIKKLNQGFTIIEVMIVLAIAGLIMAIVFIAVPQLQRNARDNSRQDAANRLKGELDTYASNNQGVYPFKNAGQTIADFNTRYITGQVKLINPKTGNSYTVVIGGGTPTAGNPGTNNNPNLDELRVYPGLSCNGELTSGTYVAPAANTNVKQYAVRVALDRDGTYYCVDNG